MNPRAPSTAIPGRGPNLNPANRFESIRVEPDGEWLDAEFAATGSVPHPRTQFFHDATETLLTHTNSPDVGPGGGQGIKGLGDQDQEHHDHADQQDADANCRPDTEGARGHRRRRGHDAGQ